MLRSTFKGFIRLSLVSVPVEGYAASSEGQTKISLNQLHDGCHRRIRYQKTCPEHGEVAQSEIIMGYEFEKDQYAVIDPDEVEQLRSEKDRSVNIDRFVAPDQIDPVYFAGKTYYLLPSGKPGEKPYALLHRAMADANVVGLAQVVISNREQLVALRPMGKLLVLSTLAYADHVEPAEDFEEKLGDVPVNAAELKLAKTLIDATRADEAEIESFHDLYNERLHELANAKISGRKITKPMAGSSPPTINLMDAIKQSIAKTASRKSAESRSKTRVAAAKKPRKRRTG